MLIWQRTLDTCVACCHVPLKAVYCSNIWTEEGFVQQLAHGNWVTTAVQTNRSLPMQQPPELTAPAIVTRCDVVVILMCCVLQAGARKVYAVEASGMANFARQLAERNTDIGKVVQVGAASRVMPVWHACHTGANPCYGSSSSKCYGRPP